ncbi:MAG: thiol:disulfide interchange protein [Bacteroidia bacterium]|jgi:thiol:disulfide interchange protein
MRKIIGFVLAIALLAPLAYGQIIPPADFSYSFDKTSVTVGDIVTVTFKGDIPDSYHIYSNDYSCPNGGPLPSVFTYSPNASYAVIGKSIPIGAKKVYDDIFLCDITEFHHKAVFKQKFKVLNVNPKITGLLEYQMCTADGRCVLHEYEIELKGITVSADTKSGTTPESIEPTKIETPEIQSTATTNVGIDSATVARLLRCLDCGEEEEVGISRISADAVNYSSYQKMSKRDTASCELKTFAGDNEDSKESYWGFFILAFLSGLVALLTPCVFPMIPMTVSFFMKDGGKGKAIRAGLIYGISIIAIYVIVGTIVAATAGPDAAHFLSTHWLPNTFFFLIFVIFAASFFGAFEITLPSRFVNKIDKQADKGGLAGIFFMAFTIVLVSFSCTGPIVGAILVESAGGQFIKPLIGMFGFSMAFAIPFTLFAIFPSWLNNLPQSGGWLNTVKVVLGFIELALGLKFLSVADQAYHWGILDREIYIGLWIVIFSLMGIYLMGKIKFAHDSETKFLSVPRLFMVIITFSFVAYLTPGMVGAPLKALAGYLPPMHTHDFNIVDEILNPQKRTKGHNGIEPKYNDKLHIAHGIRGYFDYEQGLEVARTIGRPAFVDFTGHGCVNCREMEAVVWSDPEVRRILDEEYVVVSLYTDEKEITLPEDEWYYSKYDGKLIQRMDKKNIDIEQCYFNKNSQPLYALLDNNGELLQSTREYNLDVEEYIKFLNSGLAEYKARMKPTVEVDVTE